MTASGSTDWHYQKPRIWAEVDPYEADKLQADTSL